MGYKTEYELLIEELIRKGKVRTLSEIESSDIINEIYHNYDEFLLNHRLKIVESEKELRNIVINI
jgi:hypothetical protein